MARQIRKMKLKICLVGERAVGKTSLLQRYVFNRFDEAYTGTLGSKLYLISFSKHVSTTEIVEAQVGLFDFMGEHAPRDAFRDAMFWGAHGFLAVADLSRPQTVRQLPSWVNAVRYVTGEIPFTVLLNKADLAPQGAVPPEETKFLLQSFPDVPFMITSAKTSDGVAKAFQQLLERIVNGILSRSIERAQLNVLASRVLGFAHKRGAFGVTTNDLLVAFRGVDHGALMTEVHALERLGYITLEPIGPNKFRLVLTPVGEATIVKSGAEEYVIEEPT